jgi:hypothetical protein
MTPDMGYHVLDVQVDGVSVGAVTSYPFTNVTADHTIAVSFERNFEALDFAGTDAFATFGNPGALKLTSFTIEMWMRRDGAGIGTSTGTGGTPTGAAGAATTGVTGARARHTSRPRGGPTAKDRRAPKG